MQNSLPYRLGKKWGALPVLMRLLFLGLLAVLIIIVLLSPETRQKTSDVAESRQPEASKRVAENQGNCSPVVRHNFQQFLLHSGFQCSEVNFCSSLSPQDTRVTCNNNQFAYRIKDKGKGYFVEPD